MSDLFQAIEIFLRYDDPIFPISFKNNMLFVKIDPTIVSQPDIERLDYLGFKPSNDIEGCFCSTGTGFIFD